MDGTRTAVFRFDFLVEKLSPVSSKCILPGVSFRFLDFHPVLVEPALNQRQKEGNSPQPEAQRGVQKAQSQIRKDMPFRFNKGKSCYFEATYLQLIQCMQTSPIEVTLVDLVDAGNGTPRAIGRGKIDLSPPITGHIPDTLQGTSIVSDRNVVTITDSIGRPVASLSVKHHLVAVAEFDIQGHANEPKPAPLGVQCLHRAEQSLEKLHSTGRLELPSQCKHTPVQNSNLDKPVSSGTTLEDDKDKSDPEQVPLYLPNAMCPPPLFYHCPPTKLSSTPPCLPGSADAPELPLSSPLLPIPQDFDSASAQHWAVVMAHDQRNHPISETQRKDQTAQQGSEFRVHDHIQVSEDVKTSNLPLLLALLEEFAVLKSHMESFQQQPQHTAPVSTVGRNPEKATKCLQTDSIPIPTKASPSDPTVSKTPPLPSNPKHHPQHHSHQHSQRFLRECCKLKPTNRPMVPKGKSVIYGADIPHKHRKRVLPAGPRTKWGPLGEIKTKDKIRVAVKPTQDRNASKQHTGRTTQGPTVEQRSSATHHTAKSSLPLLSHGTPPNVIPHHLPEEQHHFPVSSSSSVRRLDVFIPQALPEVATTLFSSGSSSSVDTLKSCQDNASTEARAEPQCKEPKEDPQLQASQSKLSGSVSISGASGVEVEVQCNESSKPGGDNSIDASSPQLSSPLSPHSLLLPQMNPSEVDPTTDQQAGSPRQETLLLPTSTNISIAVSGTSTPKHSPAAAPTHIPSRLVPNRRLSVDFGSPVALSRKHVSLLNVTGSQTMDSFMSMDSIDIATSTVLPKNERGGGGVYLASSQSSFGGSARNLANVKADNYNGDDPLSPVGTDGSLSESIMEEIPPTQSQEEADYSLQYSDDFELSDSNGSTSDSDT